MPTAAITEGICVSVRRDAREHPWQFVFRDLRGELLTDELPPDGDILRDGVVARQVQECDVFLFFFDPSSSENPADVDKHHQRELKRATNFIAYVLKTRENHHLPIIFVQTHLDRWENDTLIRARAESWTSEVHSKLVDLYDAGLRRIHPKSIVDRSRVFFAVSSIGNSQDADARLDRVVEHLNDLVADSVAHRRRLGKTGRRLLIAGFAIVALFFVGLLLLHSFGTTLIPPTTAGGRPTIATMSEREIIAKLDKLESLLSTLPRGTQLPTVEEAKALNDQLKWLAQRLEPNSGGMTELSEETQQRMRSAFDDASKRLLEKATSDAIPHAELTEVLRESLTDLPDLGPMSASFAEVQSRYWKLQRAYVVEQIASVLRRRSEVASPPIDALVEAISKLREFEQEVRRSKVFGPTARQELTQEIQTAATFCEDRKKSGSYPIVVRVASAADSSKRQADLALRNLTLLSPGRNDWLSRDGVVLVPNNEQIPLDITPTVHWGPDCRDGYANSVKLQIDGVELWNSKATSKPNVQSELGTHRITRKRSETLVIKAHITITDGTFVVSSREHGTGGLSVKVGDLIDGEQKVALNSCGNMITLTATRADGNLANEFHTKEREYAAEVGLGTPLTAVLSVHNARENNWRKLFGVDLATEQGPFSAIGMPLLHRGQSECVKLLQQDGMELKLELSGFPQVPDLLWDVATKAMERTP